MVPRTVLEARGATHLRDVLRNVPGISIQAGEGGGGLPGDVTPVTRGTRVCFSFWLQSMIRDDGRRSLLSDLDLAIQRLSRDAGDLDPVKLSNIQLTGVYHNLLRQWAEITCLSSWKYSSGS